MSSIAFFSLSPSFHSRLLRETDLCALQESASVAACEHNPPLTNRSHNPTAHRRAVKRSIPRLRPRLRRLKTPLRRRIEHDHIRKTIHLQCPAPLKRNNPSRLRTHQLNPPRDRHPVAL